MAMNRHFYIPLNVTTTLEKAANITPATGHEVELQAFIEIASRHCLANGGETTANIYEIASYWREARRIAEAAAALGLAKADGQTYDPKTYSPQN